MAWCGSCERYLTPATLAGDGACPSCGSDVKHPAERAAPAAGPPGPGAHADASVERIPWHFWLLLAAAAVYLGWRAVQGVALLF